MGFYGCLWTGERVFVEPLTPLFDLTTHWMDDLGRRAIAAGLHAFLNTVKRIEAHYASLPTLRLQDRTYPYKTDYQDSSGQQISFRYTSQYPGKLVFRATTETADSSLLCVKFARQYSETTHRFLSRLGHAPTFRAIVALPGGWYMIVMDYTQYVSLENPTVVFSDHSRDKVKLKVMEIVQNLHDNNLVHGDIRPANILADLETLAESKSCAIHIIDFDWAGTIGEAKYPLRVNTKTVLRPEGASDGQLITAAHDIEMVRLLWTSC